MTNTLHYDFMVKKLREFFQGRGFVEVPAQSRVSIIAACKDPKTITQYKIGNVMYPLPQTGQMWLEYELLKNPHWKGVYCITTSYRDEPVIIQGRHHRVFPMFEFEAPGDFNALRRIERDLLFSLGLPMPSEISYTQACQRYESEFIEAEHEAMLCNELSPIVSLERFPIRTNPFWNMKQQEDGLCNKIDVLMYGMETIGSGERATNVEHMRDSFFDILEGQYSQLLFDKFSKERVLKELDEYLSHDFFPRFGAGIDLTRLENALHKANLFECNNIYPAISSGYSQSML